MSRQLTDKAIEEILNEDSDSESVLGGQPIEQISDISDCEESLSHESDSNEDLGPEIEASSENEPVAGPRQRSYH